MKTDLNDQHDENDMASSKDAERNGSVIGTHYRDKRGGFWIATQNHHSSNVNISIEEDTNGDGSDTNNQSRDIVGCVGVRLCNQQKSEGNLRDSPSHSMTFEMHRLVVSQSVRGKGIARALLRTAEEFCKQQVKDASKDNGEGMDKGDGKVRMIAETLAMFDSANQFYRACGFSLIDETVMAKLTIRTYAKDII